MNDMIKEAGIDQIEERLGDLRRKAPAILKASINETTRFAKKKVSAEIKKKYAINQRKVNITEKLAVKTARMGDMSGIVSSKGPRISRRYFTYTAQKKGIKSKIYRNETPEILKNEYGKAFINNLSSEWARADISDIKQIIMRSTRKRLPIVKQTGPSVSHMIKGVINVTDPEITRTLEEAINRRIERTLKNDTTHITG